MAAMKNIDHREKEMVRGIKQKPKKMKLNRKVKIGLFFFFCSVLLLAGFSLWGEDAQLGKGSLTGAVTGEFGGGIGIFAVPTIDSIAINSTFPLNNNTNQNITAHVTTSDTDGDVVKVIYNWYLNDTSIAIFNIPMESSPPYNATDYSGNGNHGDPNKSIGDPPVWNESIGYDGRGAYNFTTTDQYIGLGLSTYTSNRGSIALWIKSYEVAIGADRWIFGRNQGGNVDGDIGLEWQNVNDTLTFFIQNGASTVEAQSNAVFGDTDWHLLVGTWSTTEIALYIDGVKNGNDTGMTLNAHANGFSFAIGNINGGDGLAQSFPGVIDDVVFYNRTLSEEQIIALYQNRTNIIASGETSQDDRWNFSATPNDGLDDGATAYSTNITIEETRDVVGPSVQQFNSPTAKANISSGTILFNVSVSDETGIDTVIFQLTNGSSPAFNLTASSTNASLYNASVDSSALSEALQTITVYANDTEGNVNNSESIFITIDRTTPNIQQFNFPAEGQNYTSGNTIIFNASIGNVSGSAVHTVIFQLNNASLTNFTASSTNATLFNASVSADSLNEGNHTLFVYANDTAGNVNDTFNTARNVSFIVDKTAPDIPELRAPDNNSIETSTTVTFKWEVNDSISEVMLCDLIIDDTINVKRIESSNGTVVQQEVASLAQSAHNWSVSCNDTVRLNNLSATRDFTISVPASAESSGSSSGDSGGGSAPARGETPAEAAPAAPTKERAIATAEELRELIRNQRFTINIAPVARIVEAIAPIISRADSILTGRAIGAPPARLVERRSLITTRLVSITFTNRADQAVSIVPTAHEQSLIRLPDEQKAEQIIKEKIRAVLAAEARQLSEKEIAQRIAETIETVKLVEEEDVQFISTTRALARQKGIFSLPTVDGSVSYSGGHTTGRLLKPEILDPDETIVPPGQTITKNYNLRRPISIAPKPVTLTLTSAGEDVFNQTINITDSLRIGTALSLDPEQGIIDVYILIPKGEENNDTVGKRYVLEFNINEGRSFFFPSSKYSETFGPYEIKRNQIFAQELQYDQEIYQEEMPVSLKIYEEGELVVENDYTVDFKAGIVREGVKPSLFTGLAITGRAIFAGLDPRTQTYGSYLLDGILLLVLVLLVVMGIAYLRQITLSALPHRPLPGVFPAKIAPYIPRSLRSAFLEKELTKIKTNLSALEEEEVRLLLKQREKIERLELQKEEREITLPKPTIIPFPERHLLFREELQDVEKLIRSVEKMPLSRMKVKTTIPAVSPAQEIREHKKTIEQELEKVTGVLATEEKRPTPFFAFLSKKRNPTVFDAELQDIEQRLGSVESLPVKHGRMKTTIPTLSPAVARWEIIQERKKAIDKELRRVTGDLARAERRPSSLLNRLLAGKRTRETKAARTAWRDVLRINRKVGGGKQGNELAEIEQQLANLDAMRKQKVKMRTVIPSMKEIVRQVEYERARLREERTAIENLLENKADLNRKATAVHVKKTKELEEIERALGAVETMPTAPGKIRTAIPVLPQTTKTTGSERKSSIDAELREITSTLARAEKKPASLLGSLFGRKQKREKKADREALREVLKITRRIEKSGARAGNELVDIERELAALATLHGQKVRLRETIPAAAELKKVIKEEKDLIEEKAAIEHLLAGIAGRHASAAAQRKEQLRMSELAVIERTLKETDDFSTQKLRIAQKIPAEQRKTTEPAWLSLLRSQRVWKSEKRHLKAERPPQTKELKAIERQLETLDTLATARMKIRRFLPSTDRDLQANMQNNDEDTRLAEEKQAIREILEKVAARQNTPKAQMKREEKKRELAEIQKAIERVETAPLQPVRMKTQISNPKKEERERAEEEAGDEADRTLTDGEKLTSFLQRWLWNGKGRKRKKQNENITEPAPEQQAYSPKTDYKQPKQNKELRYVQEKLRRLDHSSVQEPRRVNVRTHVPPPTRSAAEVFDREMNDLQQKRRDQRGWLRQTFQSLKSSPAERKREKMMVHELRDIDSSLAKVEEIMNRRKNGKVLRSVPDSSVSGQEHNPDQLIHRPVSERLKIRKKGASPELKKIEGELERVEREATQKVAIRMTIPQRKELPRLTSEEIRKIAEASGHFDSTGTKERRKLKQSKELREVEERLERMKDE